MKRTYALLAACSIALLAFSASAVPLRRPGETTYPAPTLQFHTLDGKELGRKDFAGKLVLVDFWATWCGYCAKARPEIEAIAKRHASQPFTRVSISADSSEETLRRFLAAHPALSHQVWDGQGELRRLFGVRALPTFLLIDSTGQVVHLLNGWSEGSGAGLDRVIATELAKLAPGSRSSV